MSDDLRAAVVVGAVAVTTAFGMGAAARVADHLATRVEGILEQSERLAPLREPALPSEAPCSPQPSPRSGSPSPSPGLRYV